MTKVAFVVQRYGPEIVGGAESLCRSVAERLVKQLGWEVTVYTTQAREYVSWKNEIHCAEETINNVRVKRFPVRFPRSLYLFGLVNHKLTPCLLWGAQQGVRLRSLSYLLEKLWLILQGPYTPRLVKALRREASDYDKVYFFTYLYYPTLMGAKALKGLNYHLIPTAHDEAPFYFQHTQELLENANRILVNVKPEQDLIEKRLQKNLASIRTAGVGVELLTLGNDSWTGLGRYILYLGRICKAKGVQLLIDGFLEFVQKNPQADVNLCLAGRKDVEFDIPAHPRIRFLGFLSEEQKASVIQSAACVVNPSQYESLSLIAVEAMMARKPVLLNQSSDVLAHYCEMTSTCYPFEGPADLAVSLKKVLDEDWTSPQSQEKLIATAAWADQRYSWPAVLEAYQACPPMVGAPP
jgi:glycosyltransferase involved in cell wall biosynthesis